jgi:ATP-dependent RNA helicase DDX19/DBP5
VLIFFFACQVLLFSATFGENVKQFALRTIPKANYIFVEKEALSLDAIKQYKIHCPNPGAKIDVLQNRIFPAAEKLGQSIIFVRTRHSASELHKRLEADGYKCTSIQGGLSHEERDHVIQEFRSGETKILIATDVLSRGFDQAQVFCQSAHTFLISRERLHLLSSLSMCSAHSFLFIVVGYCLWLLA